VMDLYIIKVNPENENQYEMNGEWVDMDLVTENILVAGKDDVLLPVRITQFGPIISDSFGPLQEFSDTSGMDLPEEYAIALRWTALEVTSVIGAIIDFNFASNWEEFREATRRFAVPAQNLLYADVEGNIGYQMPGNIPIRANGDGRYPVPGWTDEFEWKGYIPFEELPHTFNPESGYIVTANNAVVSDDYAYLIADTWAYGYRAERIEEMILDIDDQFSIQDYLTMQMDNQNVGALNIIPYLTQLEMPTEELAQAKQLLEGWDGQQSQDSAPAALFSAIWNHLLAATFHDDLPEDYWPSGSSRWYTVMENILEDPNSFWWDDQLSGEIESRDDILMSAFSAALAELEDIFGSDSSKWAWGEMHTLTFEHPVMSSIPLVGGLFNRGAFPTSGGGSIVNATSWDAATGSYEVTSLPSKRTILDLSDWQNSLQIHSMGQSGHAYHHHYMDMTALWAQGENLPMHWELESIQSAAESLLILQAR
jgi:penicillin amidase